MSAALCRPPGSQARERLKGKYMADFKSVAEALAPELTDHSDAMMR